MQDKCLISLNYFQNNELASFRSSQYAYMSLYHCELMDLNIFDMVQSIVDIILIDAQIVPSV